MSSGNPEKRAVAVDLGGTRFRVAVGTSGGAIEWRVSRPTRVGLGREAVLDDIFTSVDEAISTVPDRSTIKGIGIGAPGPLDPWSGVLFSPPNLPGWDNTPLKSLFQRRFGLHTVVGNDANLAALGEHQFGAGKGFAHIIYVTVSTGIGGGVIVDDRLLVGHCGLAGEIGHMVIDMDGPPCKCGNFGCLEALASGTAIARRAKELVSSGAETDLNKLPPSDITAKAVAEAAYRGDEVARSLFQEAGIALGVGFANLVHIFNPQRIIVGGGVSNAGELLWGPMMETVRTRTFTTCQRDLEIVPAALGDDAGILGAVAEATRG